MRRPFRSAPRSRALPLPPPWLSILPFTGLPRRTISAKAVRVMSRGALDAPRLVDNPFEDPDDSVPFERAARVRSVGAHVVQHLFLPIRLIYLEPEFLLQLANLERAVRTFIEQLHQPLVKMIDPLSELVDGHECVCRLLASEHTILLF